MMKTFNTLIMIIGKKDKRIKHGHMVSHVILDSDETGGWDGTIKDAEQIAKYRYKADIVFEYFDATKILKGSD